MIRSKGNKTQSFCERCHSDDVHACYTCVIDNTMILGFYNEKDLMYYCAHCGNFERFKTRLVTSLKRAPLVRLAVGKIPMQTGEYRLHY